MGGGGFRKRNIGGEGFGNFLQIANLLARKLNLIVEKADPSARKANLAAGKASRTVWKANPGEGKTYLASGKANPDGGEANPNVGKGNLSSRKAISRGGKANLGVGEVNLGAGKANRALSRTAGSYGSSQIVRTWRAQPPLRLELEGHFLENLAQALGARLMATRSRGWYPRLPDGLGVGLSAPTDLTAWRR